MKEIRVKIPEEKYQILEFVQNERSGIAIVNSSLKNFEFKKVFAWHCSIMIELIHFSGNGMPSKEEKEIIDEFEEWLGLKIKGVNVIKPNALFLSRITWNETIELIWRVFEPEKTNSLLEKILHDKIYKRKFDYRIDFDEDWKLTEWHLLNF